MKKLFLLHFVSLSLVLAYSQDKPDRMITGYVRFQAKLGGIDINEDDLNDVLEQNGFVPFKSFRHNEFAMLVKRPHRRWGSTFSYTDFYATNNDKPSGNIITDTTRNRTFKGFGFKLSADYYILDRAFLKVYVPLSVHWTKLRMHTFENIPPIFNLNNSVGIDKDMYTSWKNALEVGLNLESGIPLQDLILSVGVNIGYRFNFNSNPWKYENEISVGFPSFKNQGLVFGISFGLNGVHYRPKKPQM